MQTRSAELTAFLTSLHKAINDRAQDDSDARHVTEKIMQSLKIVKPLAPVQPVWLPVCDHLDNAMDNVAQYDSSEIKGQTHSTNVSNFVVHAQALQAIAPKLAWWQRTADVEPGSLFSNAHANATVIGRGGLEERDDVWVGISLLAPGIEYPEHYHPPEEVYLVMSPGDWQQAGGAWFEPGISAVVHNTPNILHAMRSGSEPLLATWCLWNRALSAS